MTVARMTIDDHALRATANNLTLLRLVLASAVIWTHSIWRLTGREGVDELSPWLGAPISSFAVDGFFFLSGFLVYASLLRRGSVADFLLARFARLWPGLAVAILGTTIIGYFLAGMPGRAYFGVDTAKFIGGNLSLAFGHYSLTGLRCGAALCNVNGSLWTIPWEVRCYLLLALAFVLGLSRPAMMKAVVLPATLVFAVAMHVPQVSEALSGGLGRGIMYNLMIVDRLWTMFALGIAAFVWRDRIVLCWSGLGALLAVALVSQAVLPIPHLGGVLTGYAVLCAGFLSARRGAISGNWPDYSYGMYVYAFPVMMAVSAVLPFRSHALLALANAALTLPLAALSWHLVERPALSLVRKRRAG